jgi:hypothetical protein
MENRYSEWNYDSFWISEIDNEQLEALHEWWVAHVEGQTQDG